MEISVAYFSKQEKCLLFKEKGTDMGVGFAVDNDLKETLAQAVSGFKKGFRYSSYSYKGRKKYANDWVRIKLP